MIIVVLAAIDIIMFILALIYSAVTEYTKHDRDKRIAASEQYQDHIDDLVTELFPQSPADIEEATVQEADAQYEQSKRKMVADIRTYFDQRKMDAAIARMPGPDELAPVNPFNKAGTAPHPTPPSIQMLLE